MLNKLLLYFHTLRYLKLKQFKYRIYYFIRNKFRNLTSFTYSNTPLPEKYDILSLENSIKAVNSVKYNDNNFSFLNLEKEFENGIDWNDATHGKLWTYNLNYFEFLHTPTISKEDGLNLINDFIYQIEKSKDGLEPYPISLRVIHWIKFLAYHKIQNDKIDQSLYNQLWILIDKREYHILGNHLLENGFGLLFGAYYFNNKQVYKIAKTILVKELNEQILADGAHFELSPMYHQLMFYRVLDSYNLIKNNLQFNQELLSLFKEKAQIMLGWLEQMTFKNGDIPLLNDSAFNINPTTKELIAYAHQLGIKPQKKPLKESGYRKISNENFEIILDIGHIGPDYLPGHAHSDTFNFVLYAKGKPYIIDTGISTYNSTKRRHIERSTNSHNTVQIGNYEQSEIWSSFRVARRTYPQIETDTEKEVTARLEFSTTNAIHHRQFKFYQNKIVINDTIKAKENGKTFLHFHPFVKVEIEENCIKTNLGKINIDGAEKIELLDYLYAPEFNILIKAKKVAITFSESNITTIYL
jgi:hypothetical protein